MTTKKPTHHTSISKKHIVSWLRTIAFCSTLALAAYAIYADNNSATVWAFLGYALGSSGAGFRGI